MGFPAGEESVRKLKDIKPAAAIIHEMIAKRERSFGRLDYQ
jgi:hypothetical protein